MDLASLLETIQFAAEAHKNQRRKGNGGSPYINHLLEVSSLLANISHVTDIVTLQSAVLHDILEDTSTSEDQILNKFGSEVLENVKYLSDDKSLSLGERRQKQLDTISHASHQIKLIKLADHCSNIASIPMSWDKERLDSYLNWSSEVAKLCFDASEELEKEYKERYKVACETIKLTPTP